MKYSMQLELPAKRGIAKVEIDDKGISLCHYKRSGILENKDSLTWKEFDNIIDHSMCITIAYPITISILFTVDEDDGLRLSTWKMSPRLEDDDDYEPEEIDFVEKVWEDIGYELFWENI